MDNEDLGKVYIKICLTKVPGLIINIFLDHSNINSDTEKLIPKPNYPYSVFFIFSNEFCERFNYYGMRSMKIIWFGDKSSH